MRDRLIANVDPIPSANDNLLLIRGVCNLVVNSFKREVYPIIEDDFVFLSEQWEKFTARLFGPAATPLLFSFVLAFEGSLVWSILSAASSIR